MCGGGQQGGKRYHQTYSRHLHNNTYILLSIRRVTSTSLALNTTTLIMVRMAPPPSNPPPSFSANKHYFQEYSLQYRPQTIHLAQAGPGLPPSRHATHTLPPWTNLRLAHLLLANPRFLCRVRKIRTQRREKGEGHRTHRLLPRRAPVLPRAVEGAEATGRRPADEHEQTGVAREETTSHGNPR